MKIILNLEELGKLLLAFTASLYLGYAWWVFLVLLLLPDFAMIAYLINTKTGAWIYNLFHHQGMAVLLILSGFWIHLPIVQLGGWIIFGHSALDRSFGYGLKYEDHFKHTHLGWIGNQEPKKA